MFDQNPHFSACDLSADGRARREQILRLARCAARRRRRSRRLLRATAGASIGAAIAIFTWEWQAHPQGWHPSAPIAVLPSTRPDAPHPPTSVSPAPISPPAPEPARRPEVVITFIRTEPDLATRLAVPPQAPTWQRLDDDALLRQLASAGHPAGLAWVGDRETILFRDQPVPAASFNPNARPRRSTR